MLAVRITQPGEAPPGTWQPRPEFRRQRTLLGKVDPPRSKKHLPRDTERAPCSRTRDTTHGNVFSGATAGTQCEVIDNRLAITCRGLSAAPHHHPLRSKQIPQAQPLWSGAGRVPGCHWGHTCLAQALSSSGSAPLGAQWHPGLLGQHRQTAEMLSWV